MKHIANNKLVLTKAIIGGGKLDISEKKIWVLQ